MSKEYKCELCGSGVWRVLHAGDESNCECEGECLRVCDNPELEDGCDGVAELVKGGEQMIKEIELEYTANNLVKLAREVWVDNATEYLADR